MPIIAWVGFIAFILFCLALDLGVFHKKSEAPSLKSALSWTAVWVTVSLLFDAGVFRFMGREAGMNYLAGYLVEMSLSLDNIFVIAVIFSYFKVPPENQHRLLFYGILGAQVLRGIMIGAGTALVRRFDWTMYLFGALLVYTAWKMYSAGDEEVHPEENPVLKLAKRFFKVTHEYHGDHFTTVKDGVTYLTPMALALVVVETSDVIFAVDSIPAIFGITTDPFIVFTSNVFAILGLRSLFFALAWMMARFKYLKPAVIFVLAFVGVKMLLTHHYHMPVEVSLAVIVLSLATGVVTSLVLTRDVERPVSPTEDD
ncbi:MAG: tellurite resistance protein TerC [Elusimicrobia bacterium]|nr:MAG: tellurite resistance protein TerC [Elusimicrobiota bacterium]